MIGVLSAEVIFSAQQSDVGCFCEYIPDPMVMSGENFGRGNC